MTIAFFQTAPRKARNCPYQKHNDHGADQECSKTPGSSSEQLTGYKPKRNGKEKAYYESLQPSAVNNLIAFVLFKLLHIGDL